MGYTAIPSHDGSNTEAVGKPEGEEEGAEEEEEEEEEEEAEGGAMAMSLHFQKRGAGKREPISARLACGAAQCTCAVNPAPADPGDEPDAS